MNHSIMPKNEWNDDYKLNVPQIDKQHEKLFKLAFDVEKAIYDGRSEEILDEAFQRMIDYIQGHFTDEEKLMAKINYPGRKIQRNQHDEFTKSLIELQERRGEGLKNIASQVVELLKNWFVSHIKYQDMKIALFITSVTAEDEF